MVNKKTKKKTKWRSLSLGPGHDEEQTNDDPTKKSIPFKMEWKINHNTSNDNNSNNNGYSNSFYRNSASNSHRFDKRASSKSYSKYHNTSSSYAGNNHHANKYEKLDKDLPKKVQFNEDEYTRITTPRQDVLFKKGYLSRPKTQPSTPTHQPNAPQILNGDGIYTTGYITADSPPLTINDCSPNGIDYPYYPSQGPYINDALINNSVYGNPVYLMPFADYYYQPQGIDYDYNSYQYSPPLIEPEENASQPAVSITSTNCSESSESSEETTTTHTAASPVKETPALNDNVIDEPSTEEPSETIVDVNEKPDNLEASQQNGFENGYGVNPYMSPPIVYYCVPPLSLYPVPALSPFGINKSPEFTYSPEEDIIKDGFPNEQRHSRYPIKKRKKRYRKAMSSSTSVTDYSEDDYNQQDASADSGINEQISLNVSRPVAPSTPESIFEIAHQSTLNVEVEEFRPKTLSHSEVKPESISTVNGTAETPNQQDDTKNNKNKRNVNERLPKKSKSTSNTNDHKKLNGNTQIVNNATISVQPNVSLVDNNNSNVNGVNVKKRSTNPALDKKFLIESTKKLEMQNIDLKQTKLNENMKNEKNLSWVVVGGKNRTIKVGSPVAGDTESSNQVNDTVVTRSVTEKEYFSSQETVIQVSVNENPTNGGIPKKASKKSKQKNKSSKKNGLQNKGTKLQGFVIEEPVFNSVRTKTVTEPETEELSDAEEYDSSEKNNTEAQIDTQNLSGDEDIEIECTNGCSNSIDNFSDKEDDCENLNEVALIEDIVWTEAEIKEIQDAVVEQMCLVPAPNETQTDSFIPNNNTNDKDQEMRPDTIVQQEKADDNQDNSKNEADTQTICSNACEAIQSEIKTELDDNQVHDILDQNEKSVEIKPLMNGHVKHDLACEGQEDLEVHEVFTEVKLNYAETDAKPHKSQEINGFKSENRPHITAAVCNWLHNFNNTDLQSLFTIPLKPEIEENIRHCNEISHYFKDDELQNIDKFVSDHFIEYQQLSASSSLSSLNDDNDLDVELETSQTECSTSRKPALKKFGCEIM